MGIDLNGVQLLIRAHKSGVSFESVATFGRQSLNGSRQTLISILRESGYEVTKELVSTLLHPTTVYCEDFLRLLGAKTIVAIDVSDYEGAQVIHDMNRPIPDSLVSLFDLVLDGGTLEHVFDFPTALRSATRMVRPNGRFISLTMANNFCGHGFYQFSPELFYRFLSLANGYEMESCIMWEDVIWSRFYRVPDPNGVKSRINLRSEFGTYMMVQAKRLGNGEQGFTPHQSDYVSVWKGQPAAAVEPRHSRSSSKLRSELRRIGILRSAVLFVKKMLRIQRKNRVADYYGAVLKTAAEEGVLTPLEDLSVLLGDIS